MTGESLLLKAPDLVVPITSIADIPRSEEKERPFFGYAPSETAVRLVVCRECGQHVSQATYPDHLRAHESERGPEDAGFAFVSHEPSLLLQNNSCTYARRKLYVAQKLVESAK